MVADEEDAVLAACRRAPAADTRLNEELWKESITAMMKDVASEVIPKGVVLARWEH